MAKIAKRLEDADFSIFLDMDGVLAQWLLVALSIVKSVGYFINLPETALCGQLRSLFGFFPKMIDHVYICSSYYPETDALHEKKGWLKKSLSMIPVSQHIFIPIIAENANKAEYVEKVLGRKLGKNDYLVDDYTKNLNEWQAAGGTGVKFMNGLNGTHGTWSGYKVQTADEIFTVVADDLTK